MTLVEMNINARKLNLKSVFISVVSIQVTKIELLFSFKKSITLVEMNITLVGIYIRCLW